MMNNKFVRTQQFTENKYIIDLYFMPSSYQSQLRKRIMDFKADIEFENNCSIFYFFRVWHFRTYLYHQAKKQYAFDKDDHHIAIICVQRKQTSALSIFIGIPDNCQRSRIIGRAIFRIFLQVLSFSFSQYTDKDFVLYIG